MTECHSKINTGTLTLRQFWPTAKKNGRSLINVINNRPDSGKIRMSPLSVSRNFTRNVIYFITTDRRWAKREWAHSLLRWTRNYKSLKWTWKQKKNTKTLKLTLWLWHADSELPLNQQPNMKAHQYFFPLLIFEKFTCT